MGDLVRTPSSPHHFFAVTELPPPAASAFPRSGKKQDRVHGGDQGVFLDNFETAFPIQGGTWNQKTHELLILRYKMINIYIYICEIILVYY